ncbi:MAG: diacylglycerol kinase family lipid kinase [Ruminococcus sp.]|nr:diacylglycerol kinase family lipid kinase [Ruminococcus sp.]MCM1478966.1 diacylglycerol kinase family lipid kinase [Muribaculaceae bacterium]
MKKMLFVFNPHSGKGQIHQHLMTIADTFVKSGYEVTVHPTQARNDAYEKVMSRCEDFDAVVCSGGDGTLNETIKALMTKGRKMPLGYIPSGTMNDFASSLGIPKDMPEAAKLIVSGQSAVVDVGSFNSEYFTYVAGFGAFTDVSYETPQQMKNMFGSLAYIVEGMKRLNTVKSYRISVSHDGEETEDDFMFGMVSNSTSVGGIKGLTGTEVKLDDGVFEVFLIKTPKSLAELQLTINALLKRELDAKYFLSFKAAAVEFHSDSDLPWTLDGEFGGNCRNVSVRNNCKAIEIFAPNLGELISADSEETLDDEVQ